MVHLIIAIMVFCVNLKNIPESRMIHINVVMKVVMIVLLGTQMIYKGICDASEGE